MNQVPKYSHLGRPTVNTGRDVIVLVDIVLDSKGGGQAQAGATAFIGKMVTISGGKAVTDVRVLGDQDAPAALTLGIISAPEQYDPCFKGDVKDYFPDTYTNSNGDTVVPNWPVLVEGTVGVYVENARSFPAGSAVTFKADSLKSGGGDLKIIPALTGGTAPEGYILTSARVFDYQSIKDSKDNENILYVVLKNNQIFVEPKTKAKE